MTENINLLMAKFEQNLNQLLAESQLPVGVAYYILKTQTDKLQNNYIGFINSCYTKEAEIAEEQAHLEAQKEFETINQEEEIAE